jgi:hypothetical protein
VSATSDRNGGGNGYTQLLFSDGLEVLEPALEVLTDHPIHVHKNAHDLHDIEIRTVHCPHDLC